MITIKFPKKPLNVQRKKVIDLAKKLNYSEDEFDCIVKSEKISDFRDLFYSIGRWQGVFGFINEYEIEINHLMSLLDCIENKVPFTNLKWYGLGRYTWREEDFRDLKKKIENFNGDNFSTESELQNLKEMGLIDILEYKKRYKIKKEEFKEKIINISKLIKEIVSNFDYSEVLKIIDSLPSEFLVKEKRTISPIIMNDIEYEPIEEIEDKNPEELSKEIINFIKEEFPDVIDEYSLKYDIIPLFWERLGIMTTHLNNKDKFKVKKAEVLAKVGLVKERIEKVDEDKEEDEVLELLKKIEENTRK